MVGRRLARLLAIAIRMSNATDGKTYANLHAVPRLKIITATGLCGISLQHRGAVTSARSNCARGTAKLLSSASVLAGLTFATDETNRVPSALSSFQGETKRPAHETPVLHLPRDGLSNQNFPNLTRGLTTKGTEVAELLEHAQIIPHREVLHDFRLFQAKAVHVLNSECLAAWRRTRTTHPLLQPRADDTKPSWVILRSAQVERNLRRYRRFFARVKLLPFTPAVAERFGSARVHSQNFKPECIDDEARPGSASRRCDRPSGSVETSARLCRRA